MARLIRCSASDGFSTAKVSVLRSSLSAALTSSGIGVAAGVDPRLVAAGRVDRLRLRRITGHRDRDGAEVLAVHLEQEAGRTEHGVRSGSRSASHVANVKAPSWYRSEWRNISWKTQA